MTYIYIYIYIHNDNEIMIVNKVMIEKQDGSK